MKIKELFENEVFTLGDFYLDIDRVLDHIRAGDIPYQKIKFDITQWAEKILHLDRSRPDHKPFSIMLSINYQHLDTINDERLKEPIIVVSTKKFGKLVVDGNHRIAKAYMSGIDELEGYFFDEKSTNKLNSPIKKKGRQKPNTSL